MTNLKVSICMPVYNNANYLAEAIQSVIFQEFKDFELLIIDDCSTDRTAEIAMEFSARDPRIRFLKNPKNLGMVANWNLCLELAQGKYIRFLFGDDLFTSPDALTLMVEAMERSPQCVIVSSAREIINEQSTVIAYRSHFPDNFTADGHEVIRRCMRRITREHNLIGEPSAVMFRKNSATRGFDTRYRQLVDLEMWFHILEQGDFCYFTAPLCSFRHHGGQQTKKNLAELNFIDDLVYLFDDYLKKPYTRISKLERTYLIYYQFYKLLKHAKQGKHDIAMVQKKIWQIYGSWRFALLRPFYRLYTPYWQLKRIIAKALDNE